MIRVKWLSEDYYEVFSTLFEERAMSAKKVTLVCLEYNILYFKRRIFQPYMHGNLRGAYSTGGICILGIFFFSLKPLILSISFSFFRVCQYLSTLGLCESSYQLWK